MDIGTVEHYQISNWNYHVEVSNKIKFTNILDSLDEWGKDPADVVADVEEKKASDRREVGRGEPIAFIISGIMAELI